MPDEDERRDDLAATSESVQEDAARLVAIESEKLSLDAGDPRVDALSVEAERIAERIQRKSRIERDLADDIGPGAEPTARSH